MNQGKPGSHWHLVSSSSKILSEAVLAEKLIESARRLTQTHAQPWIWSRKWKTLLGFEHTYSKSVGFWWNPTLSGAPTYIVLQTSFRVWTGHRWTLHVWAEVLMFLWGSTQIKSTFYDFPTECCHTRTSEQFKNYFLETNILLLQLSLKQTDHTPSVFHCYRTSLPQTQVVFQLKRFYSKREVKCFYKLLYFLHKTLKNQMLSVFSCSRFKRFFLLLTVFTQQQSDALFSLFVWRLISLKSSCTSVLHF